MIDVRLAADPRPIGWWLKEADSRLDSAFDRALDGQGVDRNGWQILSTLARASATRTELAAALRSFDTPADVDRLVDDLVVRDWVADRDGVLALTLEGAHRHAALAPLVEEVRQRVAGVLGPDYPQLVRLLARVVTAL